MKKTRIKTAIVGVGRWGVNVARELAAQSDLVAYVSNSPALLEAEHLTLEALCERKNIEAVAVTTPIATHASITAQLLQAGKHVLCEKPLAQDSVTAFALAREAQKAGRVLMTGYVFLYHPIYQKLKEVITRGTIQRLTLTWNKYGTFDESIEFNLLTHHLAIARDLLGKPQSATVVRREGRVSSCDLIETRLAYPTCECVSLIDRTSRSKEHYIKAETDEGVVIWDGNRLHTDRGEVTAETTIPALSLEIDGFLTAISSGQRAITQGDFGARVLELHEMLH